MNLKELKCVACEGGATPMSKEEAEKLLSQVEGWEMSDDAKSIHRKFIFENFKKALHFVNNIGHTAEFLGHHPDIHLTDYKNVEINITTHAIGGLSVNDFILAANIDKENV